MNEMSPEESTLDALGRMGKRFTRAQVDRLMANIQFEENEGFGRSLVVMGRVWVPADLSNPRVDGQWLALHEDCGNIWGMDDNSKAKRIRAARNKIMESICFSLLNLE